MWFTKACSYVLERLSKFVDRQSGSFAELQGTCERLSRELQEADVGANIKHASIISGKALGEWG